MTPIQILGWIATLVVLLSFLFHGVKMRTLNSIGALLWCVWGYYTNEVSVMFLNTTIVLIHLIMIIRIQRKGGLEMERRMDDFKGV
jgi:hypothetical protein